MESSGKMEDYEVIQQIGRGAHGATFLVLHKIEKKRYVLKKIRLAKQADKSKVTAQQEVEDIIQKFTNMHELLDVLPSSSSYEKLILHCCGLDKVVLGNLSKVGSSVRVDFLRMEVGEGIARQETDASETVAQVA